MQFSVPLPAVLKRGVLKDSLYSAYSRLNASLCLEKRHNQDTKPICMLQSSERGEILSQRPVEPIKISSTAQRTLVHDWA